MRKNKIVSKILILTVIFCLAISNVYAKELSFTGSSWDDLNKKIYNGLKDFGCTEENVQNAFKNAQSITSGSTVSKNYNITWETEEKEYKTSVKMWGGGNPPNFGASINVVEKEKDNQTVEKPTQGTEIEVGGIGPYTSLAGVQTAIKKKLEDQGCPSENISDGYANKTTNTTDRGTKVNYQVTWQKDKKEYTANATMWGGGNTFYGSLSISEGKDISGNISIDKPTGVLGNSVSSGIHSPDEIINEANEFINKGQQQTIDTGNLKNASDTLYNILLTIGIFLAVAIGMYLGIKFMLASAEDKAKVKESLIPYIAGCVVIFGAFIIWKLAIMLLAGIT